MHILRCLVKAPLIDGYDVQPQTNEGTVATEQPNEPLPNYTETLPGHSASLGRPPLIEETAQSADKLAAVVDKLRHKGYTVTI